MIEELKDRFIRKFLEAYERELERHIVQVGPFRVLVVDSMPPDTMAIISGDQIMKVTGIGHD